MNVILLLSVLYVNVKGESCTSPIEQLGECVPIRSCSSLLWSFANVKNGLDPYLQKFVCSNDNFGLIVCCQKSTNYLVFEDDEDETDPNDITDLKNLINSEECGVASNSVIHNGIIGLQDFPWLVKIMTVVEEDKEDRLENVGCTGVLINELYVLYSAQCHRSILEIEWSFYVEIMSFDPRKAGCDATSYSPECSYYENYEAIAYVVHPFYEDHTKLNDIAIIRLNRRVHKSDYLQPICLPIYSQPIQVGQTLQTAGWNRTYNINDVSVKRSQSSIVISNSQCERRMLENRNISISPYEMCTHTLENIFDNDIVGFPLMSLQGDRWYIQGFGSQGDSTKVYTRVQNYLQWIQKAMGGELCLTPYNETGEGKDLSYCPQLQDAYANVHPNDEESLREFVYLYVNDDVNDDQYTLKVCCGLTPNFTIPAETGDKNLDLDINYSHCGLEYQNKYNSTNLDIYKFPWLASIMNATLPKQRQRMCGGSLITDTFVLTSGQCSFRFYQTDIMLARLGYYNLKDSSSCVKHTELDLYNCEQIQEYQIVKEIIHPFYNKYTYINDISLLKLDRKVQFTNYVQPICLPRSKDDLGINGGTLFSTGFGDLIRSVTEPDVKKKIFTILISNEECIQKNKMLSYILPITPYHMCTEDFRNSTDQTCEGDEGGPVMAFRESKWFIVGIVGNYKCRDLEPQTHTNVYMYLKWIKLNIKN